MVYLAVTVALIAWLVPYAANTKGTSPGNGPWVFLLIAPAQLLFLIFTTAGIFLDGAARDCVPALLRGPLARTPRPDWPIDQPLPGRLTEVLESVGSAFYGALLAFVGTTVQIAMTATLVLNPEALWPSDLIIIGVESLLVAAWIAYLARSLLRGHGGPPVGKV